MNPPIETIPIESITIGTRLRKDYGDIAGLAESIMDTGLLHPLVVDQDNVLICGGRRLQALRQLGFEEVPVRRWNVLDAKHRRAIELAENVHRKDLTEIEKSRDLKAAAELAREVDRDFRPESGRKGRPQEAGSLSRVAELTGTPKQTIHDAEKHVAAVDSYPFLAQPGWKQYHAMEAAESLDRLPEDERPIIANLIDEPGTAPRTALRMLQTVVNKPEKERREIVRLAASEDDRERTLAKTKAAEVPPMPDPRLELVRQAKEAMKKAVKLYPNDPEVAAMKDVINTLDSIAAVIRERTHHNDTAAG